MKKKDEKTERHDKNNDDERKTVYSKLYKKKGKIYMNTEIKVENFSVHVLYVNQNAGMVLMMM